MTFVAAKAVIIGVLVVVTPANAQQGEAIKLEDLRTPASPAFILLGVAPSAVERPTSPRAVAASLLRATRDSSLLPRNYALEVAPYWLASHPSLTFGDYYHPSPGRSLLQTLSISFATTPLRNPDDSVDTGTSVGVGVRALLVPGKPGHDLNSLRALVLSLQQRVLDATGDDDKERRALAELKPVALDIQRANKERTGWIVELAGGVVSDFPGDVATTGRMGRIGIWVTPTYRMPAGAVDLLGVLRILRDERADTARTDLDGGFRLAWRGQAVLSAEMVERFQLGAGSKHDYRLSANIEYPLTPSIRLTATVGRGLCSRVWRQPDAAHAGVRGLRHGYSAGSLAR